MSGPSVPTPTPTPTPSPIPAGARPSEADRFSPRAFTRALAGRYWKLLAVIIGCMVFHSAFTSLRLGAGGLLIDATVHLLRVRDAHKDGGDADQVPKGAVLSGFEERWISHIGGEPPTERMEEPVRFYTFLGIFAGSALVLSLGMGIFLFLKEFLAQKLVLKIIADVRQAIVDHLVGQSLGYFHRQKAGDLISRVTNDVVSLNMTLRTLFESLVQDPIAIAAGLGVAFLISWQITLIVIPFYVLLFLPIIRSGRRVKRYGRRSLEKLGEVTEDLQQLFTGIRTVKAFGMEEHERRDFEGKNFQYVQKALKMARAKITGRTVQEVGYNVGMALLLFLCGWLLYSGRSGLSAGAFATIVFAMIQIYMPIKAISKAWSQLQESKGGYDRILELLRSRPPVLETPGAEDFPGVKVGIRFEGVSFSYKSATAADLAGEPGGAETPPPPGGDKSLVLEDISFEAKAGQVVAIVGPSGAGKSTLVDLLARFYDPTRGRILVDGVDLRTYRHASYLRSVAIVSQDPFLFNATIGQNIAYGRLGAGQGAVEDAARRADAMEFIREQPEGFDTPIGERGVLLSGGQRQRLTIARAMLKNAPILILDEATSSLDSAAEREVQGALENLMEDRTTFIIAHRLSTVTHADRIIVLDAGRIVEEGAHEELLQRRGLYWSLYRIQNPEGAGRSAAEGRKP